MLLICSTFYCLSNISLLVCFIVLTYKYVRGQLLILYDPNEILDQIDKIIYGQCLVICLLTTILTVYPIELLVFLLRCVKFSYQLVVLNIFLRLTELDIEYPWTPKASAAVAGVIFLTSLYYYLFPGSMCLPTSQFVMTLGIFVCSLLSLYLAIMDVREVHLIVQSRIVQPNSKGLHKITYGQIHKRKVYVLVLAITGLLSNLFLLLLDAQQVLLNVEQCELSSKSETIAENLGNILSYLAIYGLQPFGVYYLMVWRNSKYFNQRPQQQSFRNSGSVMLELDEYRKL